MIRCLRSFATIVQCKSPLLALNWPHLPCALKAAIGIGKRTSGGPRQSAAPRGRIKVWVTDGKLVPVFRGTVIELCRRFVVTEHPVMRDGKWVVELRPVVPDELTIRNLIRESLPKRAPVVQPEAAPTPAEPPVMLPDDHPERLTQNKPQKKWVI